MLEVFGPSLVQIKRIAAQPGGMVNAIRRDFPPRLQTEMSNSDAALPLAPSGRGDKAISLSRCDFAPESCQAIPKQALPSPPLKEGRRSADRRTKLGRIAADKLLAQPVCRRGARPFSCLPICGEDQGGSALAFRRPTAALRRGLTLGSAPGRASWNHRMQTGEPSPAPVQRAPRGPITRRTGRCPEPPATEVTNPARGTALAPSIGRHR